MSSHHKKIYLKRPTDREEDSGAASPTVRFEDVHYAAVSTSPTHEVSPMSNAQHQSKGDMASGENTISPSPNLAETLSIPPALPLSAIEMAKIDHSNNNQTGITPPTSSATPTTPLANCSGNEPDALIPSVVSFHCRKFELGIDDLFTLNQYERSLKSLVKSPFEKNIFKYFQILKKLFPVVIASPRRDWKNKGLPKLLTIFPKPSLNEDGSDGTKKGHYDRHDPSSNTNAHAQGEENDEENEQEADEEDQQHQEDKQDSQTAKKNKGRNRRTKSISPSPSFQSFFSETIDAATAGDTGGSTISSRKSKHQVRVYENLADVPRSSHDKSKISSQTKSASAVVKRIHQMNHEARQQLVTMKMNRRFTQEAVDTEEFYVQGNGMQLDSVRYHNSQDFIATFAMSKDGRFYGYVTLHGKLEIFESRRNGMDTLVLSKQLEDHDHNAGSTSEEHRDCFDDERDPKMFPYPTALTLSSTKDWCHAAVADSTGYIHIYSNEPTAVIPSQFLDHALAFGDILISDGFGPNSPSAESQSSARRTSDAVPFQEENKLVFDWITAMTMCSLHRVVIGTNNGLIYLWNRKTNACRPGKIFSTSSSSSSLQKTICCLEYCAKRQVVISGCHDNTARIWTLIATEGSLYADNEKDAEKLIEDDCHLELILTLRGHQDIVNAVAITSSGQLAYTGSRDKTVIVWDAIMGKPLRVIADLPYWSPLWTQNATNAADRENYIIKSLYLSQDEYLITVVMQGGLVVFLDANVSEQMKKMSMSSLDRKVCSIALSASISMSEDQLIAQLYHLSSLAYSEESSSHMKRNSIAVISGHKSLWVLHQLDQSRVMYIDNLKAVYKKLLKAARSPVIHEFTTEGSGIYSAVNLTGTTIVTALGNAICVFKQLHGLLTFKSLQKIFSQETIHPEDNVDGEDVSLPVKEHVVIGVMTNLLRICSIGLLPSEDYVVVGDAKGKVALWSVADGLGKLLFHAHSDVVNTIAIANRSVQVASGSDDTSVMFWRLKANLEHQTSTHINATAPAITDTSNINVSSTASVTSAAGSMSVVEHEVAKPAAAVVINVMEEEQNWEWSHLQYHTESVSAVIFSNDDKFIFTGSDDKRVVIWDSITHKRVRILSTAEGPIRCLSLCSSLPILVAGCRTSASIVWNWQTGQDLRIIGGSNDKVQLNYPTDARTITSIAMSDDGMMLYTGGDDKCVRIHIELLANDFTRISGHPRRSIPNIGITTAGSSRLSANRSRTAYLPICGQQMTSHLEETRSIPLDAYSTINAENATSNTSILSTNRDFLREFILFDQFKVTATNQTVLEFLSTSRDTSTMLRTLLYAVPHAVLHGPPKSSLLQAAFTYNIVLNATNDDGKSNTEKKQKKRRTSNAEEINIINDEADSDDDVSLSPNHTSYTKGKSSCCSSLCYAKKSKGSPLEGSNEKSQSPSFFQWLCCLATDKEKEDNEGDTEVVQVILEFYAHLLRYPTGPLPELRVEDDWLPISCRKTFASYLSDNNVEDYLKHGMHPSDLISIEDICSIGSTWPHLFSQFVKSLRPVPNYEFTVEATSTVRNMSKNFIYGCSKERSPVNYWVKAPNKEFPILNERNEWKYQKELSIDAYWKIFGDNSLPVAVDPYLIPVKGIASKNSDFLAMVVEVASSTKDYSIFDNVVVRLVIKYKWSTYIGVRFTRDFAFLCIWFALYMYNTLSFHKFIAATPNKDGEEDQSSLSSNMILMAIIFLFFLYFFYHEVLQLVPLGGQSNASASEESGEPDKNDANHSSKTHSNSPSSPQHETNDNNGNNKESKHWLSQLGNDLSDYLTDMSNWFNIISYGLVTLTLCLQARLYYKKSIYYLHHDSSVDGDYVIDPLDMHRIRTVAAANLPLLVLNVMYYLGGFSVTGPFIRKLVGIFWGISTFLFLVALLVVTFAGSFMLLLEHDSYARELLQVYAFLFGDFDFSSMYEAPTNPTLAVTLLALFLFIMVIVLLNLLIAIMDDVKSDIDSRIDAETFYAKAKFILDYERTLIDATTESRNYHLREVRKCRYVISNLMCYLWKTCSLLCCWDVITDENEEIWFPSWIQLLSKADYSFDSCSDPYLDEHASGGDSDGNGGSGGAGAGTANNKKKDVHKTVEQLEKKIEVLQKMVETMMDATIVRWEANPEGPSTGHGSAGGHRVIRISVPSSEAKTGHSHRDSDADTLLTSTADKNAHSATNKKKDKNSSSGNGGNNKKHKKGWFW